MSTTLEYLTALLEKHGAVAELSRKTGINEGTIRSWLRRGTEPDIASAAKIARALGVSLDYLATGREFWPEMNDERLKRLVLRLRKLDKRTLSALEAAIDTLIATSEPEVAGSISDEEEEDQAQLPSRG